MKILLLNWQDPTNPQAGGAEIHLRELFSRLRRRGHEVVWLASGYSGASPEAEQDGIRIVRAGSRYTFGPAAPVAYRRHLAAEGFDLTVEAMNKVPLYAPLWSRSPTVLLVHHLFGRTAFREAPLPLAAATWLQERPIPLVYRRCPVQTISRSTADDLVDRGLRRERITVIHPGVDHDFYCPSTSPTRAILPTFVFIGRLQRYKRIDLLLQAFAGLLHEVPHARLVIAGRGDREASLRAMARELGIAEHVHFAGFVSEQQKRNLMRTAWANVFVSPKEGWGMTNLEAAACGTPTIASDSPGLRESVQDGRTGLLVPHGETDALRAAMKRLATQPALVDELGGAAHEYAAGFTWEKAADQTEHHLARALGRDPDVPPTGPGQHA